MNTCQCCGKRKIGEKPYCFACETKIKHGNTEECMKKKLNQDLRYCQFIFCPNRGKEIDVKLMVKIKNTLFFCSESCKREFMKRNLINETDV